MNNYRVYLFGNGWGAVAACNGLLKASFEVFILEQDAELEALGARYSETGMDALDGTLMVFAGYKTIVPSSVLEKNTCINVHYSLLPKYRGFHSTVWAILNDEPELGLTVHLMDEYIDNGPIIAQFKVENNHSDTSTMYMQEFNAYIASELGIIVKEFIDGKITPRVQDKTKASWVGKRNLEDCRIDFDQSIKYLKAFFRALVPPYPLPFFDAAGVRYHVTDVAFFPSDVVTHTGRILNIDEDGLWIKVRDGYMIVRELVDANGARANFSAFKIGQFVNK